MTEDADVVFCSATLSLRSGALRLSFAARKEVKTGGEDICNLLFPDTHLIVDQPILFDLIAHGDQIVDQLGNGIGREDIRGLSPCSQGFFRDIFLLLSEGLPAQIEFSPKFNALCMSCFVIMVQS